MTRPVVALGPAPLPGRAVPVAAACGATPPPVSPSSSPSPSVPCAASPASRVAATGLGSAGASGLVPCAISVRDHHDGPPGVEGLWRPRFPGAELVGAAADLLPAVQPTTGRTSEIAEGPRWEIVVSPGVVAGPHHAKAERSYERQQRRRRIDADMAVARLREGEDVPELLSTRGAIVAWSPRSRAWMIARLSDLDYTRLYGRYRTCTSCGRDFDPDGTRCPVCKSTGSTVTDRTGRLPAMLTLTYPGDWLTVAPSAEVSWPSTSLRCASATPAPGVRS